MNSIQEIRQNTLQNQIPITEFSKSKMEYEKNTNSLKYNKSNIEQKDAFPIQKSSPKYNSSLLNYNQEGKSNFQIKQNYINNEPKKNILNSSIVSYFCESQKYLSEQYGEKFLTNKKENKNKNLVDNLNRQNEEYGEENNNTHNDHIKNLELYDKGIKNKNFIFKGDKIDFELNKKNEKELKDNFILNNTKNIDTDIIENANKAILTKNIDQIQNNKIDKDALINNRIIGNKININFPIINNYFKNEKQKSINILNLDNIQKQQNLNNNINNQYFQLTQNFNQIQNNFNNINQQAQISSENENKNSNSISTINEENCSFENHGKRDWQCENCKYFNFERRKKCNRCGKTMNPKIINQNKKNSVNKNKKKVLEKRNGDWSCQRCKNLNFAFRTSCNRCNLPKHTAIKNLNNEQNLINDINLYNLMSKLYINNLYNSNLNTNSNNMANPFLNNKNNLQNNNNIPLINQISQLNNSNMINNNNFIMFNQKHNFNNDMNKINNCDNIQININNNYFCNNNFKVYK